jgi:hypothetical protein
MSRFVIDGLLTNRPWASNWNYHFIIDPKCRTNANLTINAAMLWCHEQFGPMAIAQGRWTRDAWSIRMNDPVDATAFRLRWC